MRATSSGPLRSSISLTATLAPSRASSSAHAAPMPDAPPVISATLPETCPAMSTPCDASCCLSDHRRALVGHGDIRHTHLHTFGALPTVYRERACDMQLLAAVLYQRMAELLSHGTECHRIHDGAVAGFEAQPQMRLPDLVGEHELMRRQRDHGLRIAGPEGTGAIERLDEVRRHRAGADGAVNEQLVLVARIGNISGE